MNRRISLDVIVERPGERPEVLEQLHSCHHVCKEHAAAEAAVMGLDPSPLCRSAVWRTNDGVLARKSGSKDDVMLSLYTPIGQSTGCSGI